MKQKQAGYRSKESVGSTLNPWVVKSLAILLGVSFALSGTAPASELFYEEIEAATQFSDDANIRDYSRAPIEYLVQTGGIKGYPDGTFRPQGTITRVEALSLIMNSVDKDGSARAKYIQKLKSEIEDGESIYDIFGEAMADDISGVWGGKAKDMIIIASNIGAGMFDSPTQEVNGKSGYLQPVTRAEFAQMAVAVIEKLGGEQLAVKDNVESVIGDYEDSYTDEKQSANPVYDAVAACSQEEAILKLYSVGIVNGSTSMGVENCFLPQTTLTREQAATIVYKAVDKSKRTPLTVTPKPVGEVRANTTIDLSQANRPTAIAGDTVVYQGKKYTVQNLGGVPYVKGLALDLGRQMTKSGETVKKGAMSDGSLEGIRFGDTYVISPNGTGLWREQWETLARYYAEEQQKKGLGAEGQRIKVGDDGWLELKYSGGGWLPIKPDWMPFN